MRIKPLVILTFIAQVFCANAELAITVDSTEKVGQKTVVNLTIKNAYSEKVESARAQLFLVNDEGKIVGQKTAWIIGGTKEKPALASGATAKYHFVIDTDKPFTKTKVNFNRIILEGGKLAEIPKDPDIGKVPSRTP